MYSRVTENEIFDLFEDDIAKMNAMYELPPITELAEAAMRAPKFQNILDEECREIGDVIATLNRADEDTQWEVFLDARVQLADLLGDIIVYCVSEAQRWNIPIADVLQVIMESNFSKLGADGKPIKDERGKFLKGPNYWEPEPTIREILLAQAPTPE